MEHVQVTQLRALVAALDAPIVLDVREPWEVQAAALAVDGARTVCIPMNDVPHRLGELDPLVPVLSLCHHGVRSLHVAAFLERHGFEHVFNVTGGIDAWSREVDASVPLY